MVEIDPARLERPALGTMSRLGFDASHPEVQAFAKSHGMDGPGTRLSVSSEQTKIVYTSDNWQTKNEAKLQYFENGKQGFLLRDTPPGSDIKYAVEVSLSQTHGDGRFVDRRESFWLNNGGKDYAGVTQGSPDWKADFNPWRSQAQSALETELKKHVPGAKVMNIGAAPSEAGPMDTTVTLLGVDPSSPAGKAFLAEAVRLPVVAQWFKAHPSDSPSTQRLSFAFDHDSRNKTSYDFRAGAWAP
ncbi:MAG: hypothetical protein HY901_28400 [Deltaproteobacteria bacterium]|nr:hypothetical protein [Deltaproteobacteria bacterium]